MKYTDPYYCYLCKQTFEESKDAEEHMASHRDSDDAHLRFDRARRETSEGEDLARHLTHLVNGSHFDPVAFARTMTMGEHRTLQQGVMREIVMPLLLAWAEMCDRGLFDDRNKATVELARDIIKALRFNDKIYEGDATLPAAALPLI